MMIQVTRAIVIPLRNNRPPSVHLRLATLQATYENKTTAGGEKTKNHPAATVTIEPSFNWPAAIAEEGNPTNENVAHVATR